MLPLVWFMDRNNEDHHRIHGEVELTFCLLPSTVVLWETKKKPK